MRVILIRQATDLQALAARLAGSASGAAMLRRLKDLNPHVDLERVGAGTVLLLPDSAAPKQGDKDVRAIGGEALDALARQIEDGFKEAAARARQAAANLEADRDAVAAAAQSEAVQRQMKSDPLFKKQMTDVNRAGAADQKRVGEAARQIEAMRKEVEKELAALTRLLG